jgi:hypothetical protein
MQKLIKGFTQFVNENEIQEGDRMASFRTTTESNLMTAIKMEVDKLLPEWNTSLEKSIDVEGGYIIYVESPEDPENYYFIEPAPDNYYKGQEEEDEFSQAGDVAEVFITKGDGSTSQDSLTVTANPGDYSMEKLARRVALKLATWISDEN